MLLFYTPMKTSENLKMYRGYRKAILCSNGLKSRYNNLQAVILKIATRKIYENSHENSHYPRYYFHDPILQKQPPGGVLKRRCS